MTPRQKDRLGLYQQVIQNCDENRGIVSSFEDFKRYLYGFRAAVAAVKTVDYLGSHRRDIKIPVENEFQECLLQLAGAAGESLMDLARDSGNDALQQKISYASAHMRVASRDIRSAALVTISESFGEWMGSLSNYGMNESILTALNIGIEYYLGIGPGLSQIIPGTEACQDCFRNVLHTANMILKERIDIYMEEMAEEYQRFYQSYRRIRMYGEINYLL